MPRYIEYIELDIVKEVHKTTAAILVEVEDEDGDTGSDIADIEDQTPVRKVWIPLSQTAENGRVYKAGKRQYLFVTKWFAIKQELV